MGITASSTHGLGITFMAYLGLLPLCLIIMLLVLAWSGGGEDWIKAMLTSEQGNILERRQGLIFKFDDDGNHAGGSFDFKSFDFKQGACCSCSLGACGLNRRDTSDTEDEL